MTTRTISGSTYTLGYDEENRLTSVSGAATASFVYDGDGKRVQGTVNGVTTSYIGDYFEWSPSTENLVANPGFETTGNWTETTITGFASTWFFRSTWGTADQHSGTYGYAISNQMYGYLRSQEIAVSPGQYYDVNAYMRGLIDPEDSHGSVLVRAAFYTSGGAAVSNVDAATVSPGSLTTTWQKRGGVVQVPATAAKLYLQLFTYHNTGWVTFDDAEVYLSDAQGNHTGSNLVANPGFETTSGWTRVPSTSYPATTFARSNDTGTLMKGRSGYGHSISNLAWGEIYTSSFIPVTAGSQYDLYAWVRGELDSDANFGNYQIGLAFYDSAGNPVSSLNSYAGDPASISPTWANRGGRVTVPAGVTQMKVLLRVDEVSGWVDFDDVELYEVVGGQRTGGNLAPDPGFETGSGWATTATFPNSTSFLRSTWGTADQHSGSYGWVISNHMYGTLTSDPISVTAGETYQVSAYLRGELDAEDSGGAWLIRVSYYNTAGTRISYHDVYTNSNNSFTGWQEKGDLTVAPAGAVSMTVAIWNYMNSSWIGFDDVRVTAVSMKKYYYAGGQRVAMREGAVTGVTGLSFLFGDHLGSTSVTASSSGTKTAEVRYKAWGEERLTSGRTPTSYRFTGQRVETEIGLYYYGARWYDAYLSHFVQPDSIIPDPYNPLDWNRYTYARYNPLIYTDPTGHWPEWLDRALEFAQGAAYQFANDMTLDSVDKVATAFAVCMDCNASDAYKQGQQAGRTVSTVVSSAEFVVGAAATGAAIAAMPATAGGGLACSGLTAGLCALPAGAALTAEGAIAVGGVAVAGHGVATMAYIKNNPLGMLGANGPQITSKTLWQGRQGRLDVENPNPGIRAGQIHFQQGYNKWIYDPSTNSFKPANRATIEPPNWLNDLLGQKSFRNAIQKGLKFLGE